MIRKLISRTTWYGVSQGVEKAARDEPGDHQQQCWDTSPVVQGALRQAFYPKNTVTWSQEGMLEKSSKCWLLKYGWGNCRTISSCTVDHFPSRSFPGVYKFKKVPEKAWSRTSETSLGRRPILHSVTTNLCVKQVLTSSYRLHQKDLISHNSKTWRWFGVISLQIKEEMRKKADVLSLDISGPFPFNEPSLVREP